MLTKQKQQQQQQQKKIDIKSGERIFNRLAINGS
jgi:hypothetical protein